MRQPTVIDQIATRRPRAGQTVRMLYAAFVGLLALGILWLAIKPYIYTSTPGTVTAPEYVISTPYNSRIMSVYAKPGDRVRTGDRLVRVRSPDVQSLRANFATALAEQTNVLAELSIRLSVAEASVPTARQRARISAYNVARLGGLACDSTATFCSEIYRENAEATGILARLDAEIAELEVQIEEIRRARQSIAALRDAVEESYAAGEQFSPVAGMVGPNPARPGQSVTPGDRIISVFDDAEVHIEWVLDGARIRQPQPGDPVYILDGRHALRGQVTEVLGIADAMASRHSLFEPVGNGQVVRVALNADEIYPPLLSTVEVRYNYWRFMDGAVELYVLGMEGLGLWRSD